MITITNARRSFAALTAVALVGGGALVAAAPGALAAKGGTCQGFSITTGGKTYKGDKRFELAASKVSDTIVVKGKYVEFVVDSGSFAVTDYTLTGVDSSRPDKNLPLDAPTVVFESKTPQHGKTLGGEIEVRLDKSGDMRLEREGGGQKMKIQAKNCAQGGLFQMEPEPSVTIDHVLGPDFRYNGPSGTGRLCITNGDFPAYESPQAATRIAPADGQGTSSSWQVSSGGRMGFVVGEDAQQGGCAA